MADEKSPRIKIMNQIEKKKRLQHQKFSLKVKDYIYTSSDYCLKSF